MLRLPAASGSAVLSLSVFLLLTCLTQDQPHLTLAAASATPGRSCLPLLQVPRQWQEALTGPQTLQMRAARPLRQPRPPLREAGPPLRCLPWRLPLGVSRWPLRSLHQL